MPLPAPLCILHLEDSPLDARLVQIHLGEAFPDLDLVTVDNRPSYEAALEQRHWDLILSDYIVPGFVGLEALQLAQVHRPGVPFIVLTGAIGEEAAVEILREGATDFLLKNLQLQRLAPAITRALKEHNESRQRVEALEQLRLREETFRGAFEASLLVTFILNPQSGRIVEANPAAASFYGYALEDFHDMPLASLIPPEDGAGWAEHESFRKGEAVQHETRHRLKNGQLRYVEIFSNPIPHLNKPLACVICHDITERVEAGRERDSQRHQLKNLRMALDEAAIWAVTNRKGTITYVNDLFAKISGYSPDELLGQNHRILKSGYHPDSFFKEMWRTISQGQIWHGMVRNRAKNGELYWVDTTIVPALDDQGQPLEYLSIRFEITAQKAAEEALATVAEERRSLLEATSVAKAVPFSEQGDGNLRFGPTAFTVLGLAAEACPRTPPELSSLLEPDYQRDLEKTLAALNGGIPKSFEAPFLKHEERLWMRWTLAREEGRLRGVLQDITETHRFQEQLLQSQKLESMGSVAGGVGHDVNNLLTVLFFHLDLLQSDDLNVEGLTPHLRAMSQAAEQMKTLVGELLSFARKKEPHRVEVHLNALLTEAQELLMAVLGRQICLTTAFGPGLPTLRLDPGQIHQVLMNLVINARDAMPEGGTIQISTWTSAEGVVLEVADTGLGIPPETIPRIFEPFFTTKPEGKGTGLGLAVVYGIVTAHGGTISCISAPEAGTRFRITLPPGE